MTSFRVVTICIEDVFLKVHEMKKIVWLLILFSLNLSAVPTQRMLELVHDGVFLEIEVDRRAALGNRLDLALLKIREAGYIKFQGPHKKNPIWRAYAARPEHLNISDVEHEEMVAICRAAGMPKSDKPPLLSLVQYPEYKDFLAGRALLPASRMPAFLGYQAALPAADPLNGMLRLFGGMLQRQNWDYFTKCAPAIHQTLCGALSRAGTHADVEVLFDLFAHYSHLSYNDLWDLKPNAALVMSSPVFARQGWIMRMIELESLTEKKVLDASEYEGLKKLMSREALHPDFYTTRDRYATHALEKKDYSGFTQIKGIHYA